jgi:hypothetical protein
MGTPGMRSGPEVENYRFQANGEGPANGCGAMTVKSVQLRRVDKHRINRGGECLYSQGGSMAQNEGRKRSGVASMRPGAAAKQTRTKQNGAGGASALGGVENQSRMPAHACPGEPWTGAAGVAFFHPPWLYPHRWNRARGHCVVRPPPSRPRFLGDEQALRLSTAAIG